MILVFGRGEGGYHLWMFFVCDCHELVLNARVLIPAVGGVIEDGKLRLLVRGQFQLLKTFFEGGIFFL